MCRSSSRLSEGYGILLIPVSSPLIQNSATPDKSKVQYLMQGKVRIQDTRFKVIKDSLRKLRIVRIRWPESARVKNTISSSQNAKLYDSFLSDQLISWAESSYCERQPWKTPLISLFLLWTSITFVNDPTTIVLQLGKPRTPVRLSERDPHGRWGCIEYIATSIVRYRFVATVPKTFHIGTWLALFHAQYSQPQQEKKTCCNPAIAITIALYTYTESLSVFTRGILVGSGTFPASTAAASQILFLLSPHPSRRKSIERQAGSRRGAMSLFVWEITKL